MNKRGIGAIVAMVLIILLVVASIVIIWAFIRPIIEKTGEGAGEGQFSVVLQIEDFKVESDGNISLTVSRGASGPDLPSLRVIIFDGTDTTTFTTEGLDKMQTKKLTLPSGGLVKKISVAPVFESSSGEEKIGNVGAKLEFSNKEVMKNHGAVAWWRFEGNADDEIKGYDGTLLGDVNCDVQGKFGKGCYFDGNEGGSGEDAIQIIGSQNSQEFANLLADGFTYSAWINAENIISQTHTMIMGSGGPWFSIRNSQRLEIGLRNADDTNSALLGETPLTTNDWYHVVALLNSSSTSKLYLNGNLDGSLNTDPLSAMGGFDEYIGNWHSDLNWIFNGTIDEPMIFNRALTAEEVKSLYNLDLS